MQCQVLFNNCSTCRLAWSVRRRQRGHETLGQFALSMRLLVGKTLLRMGRLEEAELAFKVLAGACWLSPCCMLCHHIVCAFGCSGTQSKRGMWVVSCQVGVY